MEAHGGPYVEGTSLTRGSLHFHADLEDYSQMAILLMQRIHELTSSTTQNAGISCASYWGTLNNQGRRSTRRVMDSYRSGVLVPSFNIIRTSLWQLLGVALSTPTQKGRHTGSPRTEGSPTYLEDLPTQSAPESWNMTIRQAQRLGTQGQEQKSAYVAVPALSLRSLLFVGSQDYGALPQAFLGVKKVKGPNIDPNNRAGIARTPAKNTPNL